MLDKYSIQEIEEALDFIDYQLDYGYLDIGTHDLLELFVIKRATDLFKEKLKEGEI